MHSVRDPLSRSVGSPSSVAATSVDVETLGRLRSGDVEFERRRGEIAKVFAGWPEDKIRALVDEAVAAARVTARSSP